MSINLNLKPQAQYKKNSLNQQNLSNQPSFTGTPALSRADRIFKATQVNPIVSYIAIDLLSMVIPRTIVDTTTRNPQAGIETFIREGSSCLVTDALPGIFATYVYAKLLDKNTKNKGIEADSRTIDFLHQSWNKAGDALKDKNKDEQLKGFISNVFDNVTTYHGNKQVKLTDGVDKNTLNNLQSSLIKAINTSSSDKKMLSSQKDKIKESFVQAFKSSESLKLGNLDTNAANIVRDVTDFGKVFQKTDSKALPSVLNNLKHNSFKKAAFTIATVCILNMICQMGNKYLTKRRTGSDAFVGLPGYGKNDSNKKPEDPKQKAKEKKNLIFRKAMAITGMVSIAAATVAGTVNPKKIFNFVKTGKLSKAVEFTGQWPKRQQLAVIYLSTLVSRMAAARDKNELRESMIRDYTGFINWLVLGSFVSKISAEFMSKGKLIDGNVTREKGVAGFFKRIGSVVTNGSLKSHEEIAALNLSAKETKGLYKKLNGSLAAGIAYSTIALGCLMPYVNKLITERSVRKENEKQKALGSDNTKKVETSQPQDKSNSVALNNSLSYNQQVQNSNVKNSKLFSKFNA